MNASKNEVAKPSDILYVLGFILICIILYNIWSDWTFSDINSTTSDTPKVQAVTEQPMGEVDGKSNSWVYLFIVLIILPLILVLIYYKNNILRIVSSVKFKDNTQYASSESGNILSNVRDVNYQELYHVEKKENLNLLKRITDLQVEFDNYKNAQIRRNNLLESNSEIYEKLNLIIQKLQLENEKLKIKIGVVEKKLNDSELVIKKITLAYNPLHLSQTDKKIEEFKDHIKTMMKPLSSNNVTEQPFKCYAIDPQNSIFHKVFDSFQPMETVYKITPTSETEGYFELVDDKDTLAQAFSLIDTLKDACDLYGTNRPSPDKFRYRNNERGRVRKEGDYWVITKKLPLEWD